MWFVNTPSKHETLTQCWSNAGSPSATLAQHETSTGSTPCVCWAAFNSSWSGSAYCWRRLQGQLQADTDRMSAKCWTSVADAGSFHSALVTSCWRYWHDALNQSCVNVGSPSVTLAHIQRGAKQDTVTQYWANVGSAS